MNLSFELLFVLFLLIVAATWFLLGFLYSVSGTWVGSDEEEKTLENRAMKDKIVLGQLGPFVMGRCEIGGGYQSFSGIAIGRKVWIRRRDYGVQALMRQGFPKEIAEDLEGQVMAKMNFTLSSDRLFLRGYFIPFKVAFTHQPPRISSVRALNPVRRSYRRVEFAKKKAMSEVRVVSE